MTSPAAFVSFLFMVTLFPVFIQAQPVDTIQKINPVNAYIENMNDYVNFRLSLNNDIKGFHVYNTVNYNLEPNDKNILRLSASYRWLSVAFGMAPKFIAGNDDDALKGETKTTAFSLNFNFNHWMQSLAYNKVKGYYLANKSAYPVSWQEGEDPYIRFPDLVYNSYAGQTAYKFNKNFSFSALSTQTERQLKSAGTFMPALIYSYYIVDDKTKLTGLNASQKSNNLEMLLAAGYYYSCVISKQYYISAGVTPAVGFITTKLITRSADGDIVTQYTNPVYRLDAVCSLGYNGERFFTGAQFLISDEGYKQNKTINVIVSDHFTYQFFVGYRLKAPRFLKQGLSNAEQTGEHILK